MKSPIIYTCLLFLTLNCSYHPYVPPGEIISIESPETLSKNEFAVSLAGGLAEEILDYGVLTGFIKIKYGVLNILDIGISCFDVYYPNDEITYVRYSRHSIGTMLSSKVCLVPNILSIIGGVGYGFSDLGNYTNITYGIIIGYENKYLVPFAKLSGYYGFPINPKTHDLSIVGENQIEQYLYTPSQTLGILYDLGLKVPISQLIFESNNLSVYGTIGGANVSDNYQESKFLRIGTGLEIKLLNKTDKKF